MLVSDDMFYFIDITMYIWHREGYYKNIRHPGIVVKRRYPGSIDTYIHRFLILHFVRSGMTQSFTKGEVRCYNSFFKSASICNASSGVSVFVSTLRSFAMTGCDSHNDTQKRGTDWDTCQWDIFCHHCDVWSWR